MPAAPVFFTRKFPPSVGGMETLAAGVWRSLHRARPDAHLVAHGGPNSRLPLWLPTAVLRLLWLVARRRVEVVLTGDALAFAVVSPLLRLLRVPCATMVMGLDLTYENRLYRALVHPPLRRAEAVLAISAATAEQAAGFGVARDRLRVVRLGVPVPDVDEASRAAARAALHELLHLDDDAVVLLTLGRLVRRKGARWFTAEVLPGLPADVHYALVGDGPEAEPVRAAAAAAGVADRVHLLGRVDDDGRETAMRGADLFVQPNVVVPGDMEGFGLVTIEAALRGTPVVAADLEGIQDAVVDGGTGRLLPTGDAAAWTTALTGLLQDRAALAADGRRFRDTAAGLYGEDAMAASLLGALGLAAPGA